MKFYRGQAVEWDDYDGTFIRGRVQDPDVLYGIVSVRIPDQRWPFPKVFPIMLQPTLRQGDPD